MKRILFAVFGVIVMLPMASVAATAELNCRMVNDECPAGCGYSEITHNCEKCPTGTYGPGGTSECLPCSSPNSAEFAAGVEYEGMTTDACPWTISCPSGHYFNDTDLQCVPCGQHYNAKGTTTCTISGTGENTITSYDDKCTLADRCDGKVYKLTLDKNTIYTGLLIDWDWKEYKTHTAWAKYGTGFATDKDSTDWLSDKLPDSVLQPDRKQFEFLGYAETEDCRDGGLYFREDGTLNRGWDSFGGDKTLYACWHAPNITFTYYKHDGQVWITDTWQVTSPQITARKYTSTYPSGQTFSHYLCKYGISGAPCNPDIINVDDPIPFGELTVNLYPVFQDCPAGHYCTNGKTYNCPAGTTSDPGAGSTTNCYMVRGNGGTKFCDNTGDCFYLPGSGHVPHAKAAGN